MASVQDQHQCIYIYCTYCTCVCVSTVFDCESGVSLYFMSTPLCLLFIGLGGVQSVRGTLSGTINDVDLHIAQLNGSVSNNSESHASTIKATFTNIPKSLGKSFITFFCKFFVYKKRKYKPRKSVYVM